MKELNGLERPRDHKVIDIWLLVLLYSNESMQKSIEKVFKKKIIEGCIQEVMLDQCICGNKELAQVYMLLFFGMRIISTLLNIYQKLIWSVSFVSARNIFCPSFPYLNIYWHAKNKRQGIWAFTHILFFLKSLLIPIQDRK